MTKWDLRLGLKRNFEIKSKSKLKLFKGEKIMEQVKVVLQDREIPKKWYNILADLPTPMKPPLHPGTGQPVTPNDLAAIFPMNIIEQEASNKRWIKIPEEVLQKYLLWRPSPLYRAYNFEKLLGCPVKIYYKHEGVSPAVPTSPMPPFLWLITIRWPEPKD